MKISKENFIKACNAAELIIHNYKTLVVPIDILSIIEKDETVKLLTYKECCEEFGFTHEDVINIGNSEDAFYLHFRSKAIIIYNETKPITRMRFSIAHEYGHHVLNHKGLIYGQKNVTSIDSQRLRQEEYEANTFASRLLMPLSLVHRCIELGFKESEIAFFFNVSCKALEIAYKVYFEEKGDTTKDSILYNSSRFSIAFAELVSIYDDMKSQQNMDLNLYDQISLPNSTFTSY